MIERTLSKTKGKVSFAVSEEGLFLRVENFELNSTCGLFLKQKEFSSLLQDLNKYHRENLFYKKPNTDKKLEIVSIIVDLIHKISMVNDFPKLKKDLCDFLIRLQ